MPFDLNAARTAGYSTDEIAGFLAQRSSFDLAAARNAGYSSDDIISHLAEREAAPSPTPAEPAPRQRGSTLDEAGRSLALGARTAAHAVGAIPGALYDIAALPVRGAAYLAGMEGPQSSQQLIDAGADAIGLPRPENAQERITQRVGTEFGATVTGMGVGRGLAAIPQIARAVAPASWFERQAARFSDAATRSAPAVGNALASHPGSQIAGAVGSGLAGGAASEVAPDSPMADFGAAVAGGLGASALVPITQATTRGLTTIPRLFTTRGTEDAAAASLLRASDDPTTLAARLRREGPGLEGSAPSAGEVAQDAGLLQVERAARSTPEGLPVFAARDQARDVARRDAIEGLQPMAAGDATGAEEIARGMTAARGRNAAVASDLEARAAADAEARTSADAAVVSRSLEALPAGMTAEAAGPVIRDAADEGLRAAKGRTGEAYAAIDPEGASRIPLRPVLTAADQSLERLFRPIGGAVPTDLSAAVDDLRRLVDARNAVPFSDIQALRSRVGDLMNVYGRGATPNNRAVAVLSEMKANLDDQAARAAQPYELPTSPRTSPDIDNQQALEAAAQHPDVVRALSEVMPAAPPSRAIVPDAQEPIAQAIQQRGGTIVPGDPDATLRTIRDQTPEPTNVGWEPSAAAPLATPDYVVDPVAQGTAFTPEQASKYREATAARRTQGEDFERNAMGAVTKRGDFGSRIPDATVAQQFFHSGNKAADDVAQFTRALGGRSEAAQALESYATQSLRDYAIDGNGQVVPSRVRGWLQRHAPALRQMPELNARFGSVEAAARTAEAGAEAAKDLVAAGTQAAKRTVSDFENSAARYWLRGQEPEAAVRAALGSGKAEQNLRELKVMMHGDAPALRGLRAAYADEWLRTASDTIAQHADGSPKLSANASRRFLDRTERGAAVLFNPEERARIAQVANDFRSGAMVNSVGRATGSNTTQNLMSLKSGNSLAYVLGRMTSGILHGDSALPRSLGRPLTFMLSIPEEQVRRTVAELLVDPQRAAALVERVSAKNLEMVQRYAEKNVLGRLGQAVGEAGLRATTRAASASEAGEAQRETRRPVRRADGGLVNAPGPEDDVALTQAAAQRGAMQGRDIWAAAAKGLVY